MAGRKCTGRVYLIGAGPGDPGLLTLKGKRCLEMADVIVCDRLANRALLRYARPQAEIVALGAHGISDRPSHEKITDLLIARAREGKTVVRLKGGDALIFGRGSEVASRLKREEVEFEIVPGVTSAVAAPAYAGIPLTDREYASSVAFVTGHEAGGKTATSVAWEQLATGVQTIVLLMSVGGLRDNLARLVKAGLSPETPAAAIRWGTTPDQEVVVATAGTLADRASDLKPPAVIVIGEVVRRREEFAWFERLPLFGRRILITRARAQAGDFAELLERWGAEVIEFPVIEMAPPAAYQPLDEAIGRLSSYDWLVLTSVNGVKSFLSRLRFLGRDLRDLAGIRIAVIGPQTEAELKRAGIKPDLVPVEYRAEAVAEAMIGEGIGGMSVLLPRAVGAREVLPIALRNAGARVDEVPCYRMVVPQAEGEEIRDQLKMGRIDLVTFTSSSTVRNFVSLLALSDRDAVARTLGRSKVGCIGPITAQTARSFGLDVDIQPDKYTIPAFVDAILCYFASKQRESDGAVGVATKREG